MKEDMIELMKNQVFSLFIDETTDVSGIKIAAIVVRIFNEPLKKIQELLYRIVDVPKADADSITEIILNSLESDGIPITNLIGFCSDGAQTYQGKVNGVCKELVDKKKGFNSHILLEPSNS